MPLIDPVLLESLSDATTRHFTIVSLDACDSTSSELLRRADQGAPAGTVVVADRQSAGRGRDGRAGPVGLGEGLLSDVAHAGEADDQAAGIGADVRVVGGVDAEGLLLQEDPGGIAGRGLAQATCATRNLSGSLESVSGTPVAMPASACSPPPKAPWKPAMNPLI